MTVAQRVAKHAGRIFRAQFAPSPVYHLLSGRAAWPANEVAHAYGQPRAPGPRRVPAIGLLG